MFFRVKNRKHRSRFTWFLSLLLATVAFGVYLRVDPFPVFPQKFEIVNEYFASGNGMAVADLTGNGKGEIVRLMSYNDFPAIEVYTGENVFLATQRVRGEWLGSKVAFIIADLNRNGLAEIYTFTRQNDSIFLNGFELFGDEKHFVKDVFVDVTQKVNDKYDVSMPFVATRDTNGNGYEELVVIISAGYSLFPRKLYVYSPHTGQLLKTPPMGARVHRVAFQETHEGAMQFWVSANATENFIGIKDVPYPDTSGWIFGYDQNLDSAFVTLEFSDDKPHVHLFTHKTEAQCLLYALIHRQNTNTNEIHVYSTDGELVASQTIELSNVAYFLNNEYPSLHHLCLEGLNTVLCFDYSLQPLSFDNYPNALALGPPVFPDGYDPGFIFARKDNALIVTDNSFSTLGEVTIDELAGARDFDVQPIEAGPGERYLFGLMIDNSRLFVIGMQSNGLFPFRYLLHGLVFLLFFSVLHSGILVQNYYIRKRMATEMRLVSLQVQSVQNQLQPHFTFNVLNNIASLINKGENELGYRYLNDFSDMLRIVLNHTGSEKWPLDDEIKFITSYINMENLRYSNKFTFGVQCKDKQVLQYRIPRLMIQTFAENSIRHGLVHKSGDCRLNIEIADVNRHIEIRVWDNGIGREKSALLIRSGTGKGIYILREFMDAWNKLHDDPFTLEINDLKDSSSNAAGTQVIVNVPKSYSD